MDGQESAGGRRPFAAFVQEQRKGALHGELGEQFAALVGAVAEHRKAGTLTLTIKIAPNSDGTTVTVTDKVTVKAPEAERGGSIFFPDEQGNLTRSNPAQPELPLREVGRETPPAAAGGAS